MVRYNIHFLADVMYVLSSHWKSDQIHILNVSILYYILYVMSHLL